MSYRDDLASAASRAQAAERALDAARAENARDDARIADLERQLAAARAALAAATPAPPAAEVVPPAPKKSGAGLALAGVVVLVIIGTCMAAVRRHEPLVPAAAAPYDVRFDPTRVKVDPPGLPGLPELPKEIQPEYIEALAARSEARRRAALATRPERMLELATEALGARPHLAAVRATEDTLVHAYSLRRAGKAGCRVAVSVTRSDATGEDDYQVARQRGACQPPLARPPACAAEDAVAELDAAVAYSVEDGAGVWRRVDVPEVFISDAKCAAE
jgi:hypothetical protein